MPNSILWIGLVVLWVFVLFPMLADRHPRIRQHTDAALATRVLHRGDAEPRSRKGPASGHDTDPDYVPVRRKPHPSDDPEDRMTRSDDSTAAPDLEPTAATESEAEVAELDTKATEPEMKAAELDTKTTEPRTDSAKTADTVGEEAETASITTASETSAEDGDSEPPTPRRRRQPPPQQARTPALREPDPLPEPEPETASDDEDFIPTRRGRGGFDPEADAAARVARYSFRQRTVLGLVLSTLLFAAAGFAVSGALWWLAALSGTVMVGYLVYLRRQVRIEEDIRRRRVARMSRSRMEAAQEQQREAERPRPDREETRTQLRRAVLVEPDDEDPMFEHLELFDAAEARATRQRASGARQRRAVGE